MANVNLVIIMGRLGKDPDFKVLQNGKKAVHFSVAVEKRWKDNSGTQHSHVEWFGVNAWQGLAEACHKFLKKGSGVYVEGELRTATWDDKKTGQKRSKTEIAANVVQFLSGTNTNYQTDSDVGNANAGLFAD